MHYLRFIFLLTFWIGIPLGVAILYGWGFGIILLGIVSFILLLLSDEY